MKKRKPIDPRSNLDKEGEKPSKRFEDVLGKVLKAKPKKKPKKQAPR